MSIIDEVKSSKKELIVGAIIGALLVLTTTYTWVNKQNELSNLRTKVELYKILASHDAEVVEKLKATEALTAKIKELTDQLTEKNNQITSFKQVLTAKDAELTKLKIINSKLDALSSSNNELVKQLKLASTKSENTNNEQ
ncbi:TPA: hypothetical protein ACGVAR_004309 [Vibrio vulnificus]|nr:hypothetical protein [Vibrio vulnificus]